MRRRSEPAFSRLLARPGTAPELRLLDPREFDIGSRSRNEAAIRARCQNAYLGNGQSLCRVLGRYKMYVDPDDVGLSSHLLLDGYWEMWLTEVLARLVRPGMTAIDVGANLGYFTLLMADLVGSDGQVHAFEPNGQLAQRLRRSVAINGFHAAVQVHEQALADSEAAMRLVIPGGEPKNGHLLHPELGGEGLEILTRRLDSYAEITTVDLIKIDADTSEQSIWHGMAGLLARQRTLTVVLEFARMRYPDPGAFLDRIARDGFAIAEITLDKGICPTTREAILAAPGQQDVTLLLTR